MANVRIVRRDGPARPYPIRMGISSVGFKTRRESTRYFRVHEDLICGTSQRFRRDHQQNRRPIEDPCLICREPIDPKSNHISFCEQCGHNMHAGCEQAWTRLKKRQICPICRREWPLEEERKDNGLTILEIDVDYGNIDEYVHWLYTGEVDLVGVSHWGSWDLSVDLCGFWGVANIMEDQLFMYDVVASFLSAFDGSGRAFLNDRIHSVWSRNDDASKGLKEFMLDVCRAGPSLFGGTAQDGNNSSGELPTSFFLDLNYVLMETRGQEKVTLEWLVHKYTDGTYMIVKEEEDEDADLEQPFLQSANDLMIED